MAVCAKCGHEQAEPNWCHACGGRTEWPEWAKKLEAERDRLREALLVAADDLDKAANQFAGMTSLDIDVPVVNNPGIFAAKARRAREAAA